MSVYSDIQCTKINGFETSHIKTLLEQGISNNANVTIGAFDELSDIFAAYSSVLGNNVYTRYTNK